MNRREFFKFTGLAGLASLLPFVAKAEEKPKAFSMPNVNDGGRSGQWINGLAKGLDECVCELAPCCIDAEGVIQQAEPSVYFPCKVTCAGRVSGLAGENPVEFVTIVTGDIRAFPAFDYWRVRIRTSSGSDSPYEGYYRVSFIQMTSDDGAQIDKTTIQFNRVEVLKPKPSCIYFPGQGWQLRSGYGVI